MYVNVYEYVHVTLPRFHFPVLETQKLKTFLENHIVKHTAEITIAYVSTSFLDSFLASGLTPKYQFFGEALAM